MENNVENISGSIDTLKERGELIKKTISIFPENCAKIEQLKKFSFAGDVEFKSKIDNLETSLMQIARNYTNLERKEFLGFWEQEYNDIKARWSIQD